MIKHSGGDEFKAHKLLDEFDAETLDGLEAWHYAHHIKCMSKAEALCVIINTVEGDYSQLSPELAEIAELIEPQVFYDPSSG